MNVKKLVAIFLTLMMSLSLVACAPAATEEPAAPAEEAAQEPADDGQVYTMRLGWTEANDPSASPSSYAVYEFQKMIEEKTNGRIKVELFGGGQLGTQQEMMEQVQQGVLECSLSAPINSIYSDYDIFYTPFLVSDVKTMRTIFDPTGDYFAEFTAPITEQTGLKVMGIMFEGLRHLTNNVKEVRVPSDLSGLKIRVMDKAVCIETFETLGATATPIAWGEVYSALQTNVCDGQENPLFNIAYANLQEVQDYLTLTGHQVCLNTMVVNNDWFNALPGDLQSILVECSAEMCSIETSKVDEREATARADMEAAGMKVIDLTDEEHQQWVDACQAHMIEWIQKDMNNAEVLNNLMAKVAEIEG